jgi:hypothetical protein
VVSGIDLRSYVSEEPEGNQPCRAEAHWKLGLVLEKEPRNREAAAEWREALRLDPLVDPTGKSDAEGSERTEKSIRSIFRTIRRCGAGWKPVHGSDSEALPTETGSNRKAGPKEQRRQSSTRFTRIGCIGSNGSLFLGEQIVHHQESLINIAIESLDIHKEFG